MKKLLFIILSVLFLFMFIEAAYSAEYDKSIIDSHMQNLDFDGIHKAISNSTDSAVNKISVQDLALKAIKGELDISPTGIIKSIANSFLGEIYSLVALIRNMVLVAIFSAFLNNLSLSLKQKDVSELGFYISYLIIISILISSFNICIGVMYNLINDLCMIMQSAIPTMVTLMVMSGNVNSAYVFNPIAVVAVNIMASFIRDYVTPVIIFAATLQLINYISEKEILQKLSELIKNAASWVLKGTAIIFMGVVSLQGISAPIVDNVVSKSAKATLNIVPVVGQALSGAVDTVMYWSGAVKSGVMIAIVIIIILMCAVPVIKLIAFLLVFKLTAAIIQPISDARIVKATDSLGTFTAILIGACVAVAVMFIFMTMVMLSH